MAPILPVVMGLAQVAPMIARWLGGENAGQVAEKVVGIAKAVTGAQSPEEALQRIQTDAKAALDFQLAVMANEKDLDALYLADRQDARARDVALRQAGAHNTRANAMVAMDVLGLLAGLGGMLALGWFKSKHPAAITEGVFGALLAQLSTITSYFGLCLRDAHQFEFGSSRGSKEKDALIGKG